MLTCHKNITIPPECGFFIWLYERYFAWDNSFTESLLNDYVTALLKCKKIEYWSIDPENLLAFLRKMRPSNYAELTACIYTWFSKSKGRPRSRWGDKNNYYLNHIPTIKSLFPHAIFIHIIRDGRDVACSYKKLSARNINSPYAPKLPGEIGDIAESWVANIKAIRKSLDAISREQVIEIKYEELLLDTENVLKKICKCISEEYDPAMLQYTIMNEKQGLEPREFIEWKEKSHQPLLLNEIGRYKKELDGKEIMHFEEAARHILKIYNYKLDG